MGFISYVTRLKLSSGQNNLTPENGNSKEGVPEVFGWFRPEGVSHIKAPTYSNSALAAGRCRNLSDRSRHFTGHWKMLEI
jgi:hypothetical protein